MSFLSFVLNKEYSIVTSDGLLCFYDNDGQVIDKFDEYCKFFHISTTQIVGISFFGDSNLYDSLIELINKNVKNTDRNYVDLKKLSIVIKKYLNVIKDKFKSHVVLIGYDKNNEPEMHVLHTDSPFINSYYLIDEREFIFYPMVSYESKISAQDVNDKWNYFIDMNNDPDQETILKFLKDLSFYISENDVTVNDKFYHVVVNKKIKTLDVIKRKLKIPSIHK